MKKDYPNWACAECGKEHGSRTSSIASWHYGKCDVCGKNNHVTEPRDFGHFPNWFAAKEKKK